MKPRKPTAADRPQFQRDVLKMLGALDVHVGDPTPDQVILCTRAADFDPADNVLWEHEGNKSAVRPDVRCSMCKSVVALSNDLYRKYSAMDRKPRICCNACLPALLKENPA